MNHSTSKIFKSLNVISKAGDPILHPHQLLEEIISLFALCTVSQIRSSFNLSLVRYPESGIKGIDFIVKLHRKLETCVNPAKFFSPKITMH